MRPIPIGATAAMVFSLLVAFMVTPWAAVRILEARRIDDHGRGGFPHAAVPPRDGPLITSTGGARCSSPASRCCSLAADRPGPLELVTVKMLPFDNKSEFQVIVDMPEARRSKRPRASLSAGAAASRSSPKSSTSRPTSAPASPYNFNGLVRHYFLRRGAERRGHPGQSRAEERALGCRATRSPSRIRQQLLPIANRSARASRWPRCRRDRRCCRRWSPRSTALIRAAHGGGARRSSDLRADRGRRRCRLVRRGRQPKYASRSTARRRPSAAVAARSLHGAADGRAGDTPACCTTTRHGGRAARDPPRRAPCAPRDGAATPAARYAAGGARRADARRDGRTRRRASITKI